MTDKEMSTKQSIAPTTIGFVVLTNPQIESSLLISLHSNSCNTLPCRPGIGRRVVSSFARMSTKTYLAPFQLLELNIISAQDLAPLSRNMKTYAVAWVRPDRKLSTRVDNAGRKNPTWNDKFVFRVDDEFLLSDTSAVMIEIYALHWLRDLHVGSVRVLVGNLIPPPVRPTHRHHPQVGMRFVALQVRRPSGRPQGILNIGVALLDSSRRSMPLYSQLDASAVDYRHLMGENDSAHFHQQETQNNTSQTNHNQNNAHQNLSWSLVSKPELRRTKSDTSSMMTSSLAVMTQGKAIVNKGKASSTVSGSEPELEKKQRKNKKGNSKSSSVISASDGGKNAKTGKPDSVVKALEATTLLKRQKSVRIADSEVVEQPKKEPGPNVIGSNPTDPIHEVSSRKPIPKPPGFAVKMSPKINEPLGLPVKTSPKIDRLNSGSPYKPFPKIQSPEPEHEPAKKRIIGVPFLTESELGPSPSEVASALAKDQQNRIDGGESSLLSESVWESSVEGLQSKLDRWRAELPPLYDTGELYSVPASTVTNRSKHNRRHTDDGGLFSCFSKICGIECSIVCGSGGSGSKKKKSGRLRRSTSTDNMSFI